MILDNMILFLLANMVMTSLLEFLLAGDHLDSITYKPLLLNKYPPHF